MDEGKTGRRRRSSSIIYQEPLESIEQSNDQAALPNLNANWVNAKGMGLSCRSDCGRRANLIIIIQAHGRYILF